MYTQKLKIFFVFEIILFEVCKRFAKYPNPDIQKKMKTEPKSLSFLCAYVWQNPKYFFRIFENPKIFGFFGLGYEYGPKPKPKRNQNEIVWQLALWFK